MARWEPNARMRLVRAALELCTDQGYEATTVAEIAERAGLTKTTFFRHFPDKREVLFAGQDEHSRILAEAIAAAPAEATPIEAVAVAIGALAASFTDERREFGRMLIALIAANDELKERAAYKHARLAEATAAASGGARGAAGDGRARRRARGARIPRGLRPLDRARRQALAGSAHQGRPRAPARRSRLARRLTAPAHCPLCRRRLAHGPKAAIS